MSQSDAVDLFFLPVLRQDVAEFRKDERGVGLDRFTVRLCRGPPMVLHDGLLALEKRPHCRHRARRRGRETGRGRSAASPQLPEQDPADRVGGGTQVSIPNRHRRLRKLPQRVRGQEGEFHSDHRADPQQPPVHDGAGTEPTTERRCRRARIGEIRRPAKGGQNGRRVHSTNAAHAVQCRADGDRQIAPHPRQRRIRLAGSWRDDRDGEGRGDDVSPATQGGNRGNEGERRRRYGDHHTAHAPSPRRPELRRFAFPPCEHGCDRGLPGSDPLDQLAGLGRRLDFVLAPQAFGQTIVDLERAQAVADLVEQCDQACLRGLVVGRQCCATMERGERGPAIARGAVPFRLPPCRLNGASPQRRPLLLQPVIEFRRGIGDEQPIQKMAVVQLQRFRASAGIACQGEGARVTPERRSVHTDLFLAARYDRGIAQLSAQEAKRLSKGAPCMGVIQLGPEVRDDGIAPPKTVRVGESEVGEERQALGLGQHGARFPSGGVSEGQGPQGLKPDDRRHGRGSLLNHTSVTGCTDHYCPRSAEATASPVPRPEDVTVEHHNVKEL